RAGRSASPSRSRAAHRRVVAVAAQRRNPAIRHDSAHRLDRAWYSCGARRYRCRPTRSLGEHSHAQAIRQLRSCYPRAQDPDRRWRLRRFLHRVEAREHLRRGEAEVTLVDPLPYMTYQPFLPEVAAGSIEARHSVVAHRRHLRRTNVITAKVTGINHAQRVATISPAEGSSFELKYDQIVVTAGAVSRTSPIQGIAENAIGLKT